MQSLLNYRKNLHIWPINQMSLLQSRQISFLYPVSKAKAFKLRFWLKCTPYQVIGLGLFESVFFASLHTTVSLQCSYWFHLLEMSIGFLWKKLYKWTCKVLICLMKRAWQWLKQVNNIVLNTHFDVACNQMLFECMVKRMCTIIFSDNPHIDAKNIIFLIDASIWYG